MNDLQLKDQIIKFRKEHGLTQKQLADHIHYSDKVISKWECGETYLDVAALKQLSDFFEVPIDEMIGGSKQIDYSSTLSTHKLEVIITEHPSFLSKVWIIFPIIAVVISVFYGPMMFAIASIILGLLLCVYAFTIVNYTLETMYQGINITVINRVIRTELLINHVLVDGIYSVFNLNPVLGGKIDDKIISAKMSNMISIKCDIFIS